MINLFNLQNGRLHQLTVDTYQSEQKHGVIWIDITDPDETDRDWLLQHFHFSPVGEDAMGDIEASARFFEDEDGTIHVRSDFLSVDRDDPKTIPVAFSLTKNTLFSVHYGDSAVFRLVRMRGRSVPGSVLDYRDILLDIYATDAEYSADALEDVYVNLENISKRVLQRKEGFIADTDAGKILRQIAREESVNGFIRRSMMDTRRTLSFLMRGRMLNPDQIEEASQVLRDIESLYGHTSFLSDKINFLMDAIVGFINVNQNRIVKIFSVASVALLPPTLIASLYGMNFRFMPELQWQFGYPFALSLMALSVVIPLYFFYRRGWLR